MHVPVIVIIWKCGTCSLILMNSEGSVCVFGVFFGGVGVTTSGVAALLDTGTCLSLHYFMLHLPLIYFCKKKYEQPLKLWFTSTGRPNVYHRRYFTGEATGV